MIRRLIITVLYDYAKLLTHLADALAPLDDSVWRERRLRQHWVQQHPYTTQCVESRRDDADR